MSVEAMAIVLHHSKAVGTSKVVLLGIANHHGDGGSWPSIATLARYSNVDCRSVQRAIRHLSLAGEIKVTERPGKSTRYDLLVRCPRECDGSLQHYVTPDASVTPDVDVTPDASVANPRRQRHPRGDASVTRTINEPSGTTKTPTESSSATDRKRATRIPDDFTVTADMREWVREKAPNATPDDHDAFVDYWRSVPDAKGRKVDWEATWRNWMRRASKEARVPRQQQPYRSPNGAEARMQKAKEVAARLAVKYGEKPAIEQGIAQVVELPMFGSVS